MEYVQRIWVLVITFLSLLSIASNFITIRNFLKEKKEQKNLKMEKKVINPYKRVMVGSLIITGIVIVVFFVSGGFNFVKAYINPPTPPKPISASFVDTGKKTPSKDTSKQHQSTLTPNHHSRIDKENIKPIVKTKKVADTTKSSSKYDLSHATVDHSAVGDHATTNNYDGIKQRHLSGADLNTILENLDNTEQGIKFYLINSDNESQNLEKEIQSKLELHGYKTFYPGGTIVNNNQIFDKIGVEKISYGIRITIYPASNVH